MTDPICYQPLNDQTATYELHPIGTAAELAALRALKARVEDKVLAETREPQPHGTGQLRWHPRGCSYCEGWADGIDAYRAALRGEGK